MKKKKHSTRSRAAKKAAQYAKGDKSPKRERGRGRNLPSSARAQKFQGRVQKNPKGFAFIISKTAGGEDAYVPREEAKALLNDDIVEFTLHRDRGRTAAHVERIIRRGQSEVVGQVQGQGRDLAVVTAGGDWMWLSEERGAARPGEWVRAKIEKYPDNRRPGVVSLEQSLGTNLLPKHDMEIAIARYNLPHEFSDAALLDAKRSYKDEHGNRVDHRKKAFVTIDGEDAKDFDDAILVEEDGKGFILYVAIADVAHYVRPGTQLDREALSRATSVYFPGSVVPMLPESLSNHLCSLRPREEKHTLTAEIYFDARGNVTGRKFYESLIQTFERLTYQQVQEFFDRKIPLPDPVSRALGSARKLFRALLEQRKKRGVLDFDLPECRMTLDKDGFPAAIGPAPKWDSHKLIEEFMIAANREVARALREGNIPALYRVHETPKEEALTEVNQLLGTLGSQRRLKDLSPVAFSELLDATRDLPGAATLHKAILRMQKQAHYEPDPKGHFGLALRDYTHFTSPIRRYPDLVVHRALKQLIYKRKLTDKERDGEYLVSLGEQTSERERRAMEAERFVVRRKQCWYLSKRLGEEFDGVISGVVKGGLFVELVRIASDGFLPIDALDGHYEYDQRGQCLRKRPGHETLSVGGTLRVKVVKVDIDQQEVTLGLVDENTDE